MSGMTSWINTLRPESRRYLLFGGLVVILLVAGIGLYLALRPSYKVLFRDLKPRDARVVVAALEQDKVPYSYEEETGSVLVPSDDARSMRLKLLQGGLHLQGVVGLELFDQSDLGLTDFSQKVNYQRALQGELARTIMTLDDVDMARVHLTLPDSSLFQRDQSRPRASVAIFMQGEHVLSPSIVHGIQKLIAASVTNLAPDDVVIVDQRGESSGEELKAHTSELWASERLRALFEHRVAEALSGLNVTPAFVNVDLEMSFDEITSADKVAVAEAVLHEAGTDGDTGSNKPVSAVSTGHVSKGPSAADSSYLELIKHIASTRAVIRRVSVRLDLQRNMPRQELDQMSVAVSTAVGLDPHRGDELIISEAEPSSKELSKHGDVDTPIGHNADAFAQRLISGPSTALTYIKVWQAIVVIIAVLALVGVMTWRRRRIVRPLGERSRRVLAARLQQLLVERGDGYVAEE